MKVEKSQNAKRMERFDKGFFWLRSKIIDWGLITYYNLKGFFYNQNFKKKHFSFSLVQGKLLITSMEHEDFITGVQKKLNKLAKNKSRENFIRLALNEALEGCNFIIFSVPEDDNKFVQFWTGEHKLKYNFYANDVNKLKKYFLTVVGLLSEMGFVNNNVPEYRGKMVYKVDKGSDHISVDANFNHDINLAVEFTEIVYKQIYKAKGHKLIAKVE